MEPDGHARESKTYDRRQFIRTGLRGALATGAALAAAGEVASAADAFAATTTKSQPDPDTGLAEAGPELALPPGFTYTTFGNFGSAMSDGFVTPPIPDGMGVFPDGSDRYRIVRNHEVGDSNDNVGGTVLGDPTTAYDRRAPGGTTTLIVNGNGELLDSFLSLNGTDSNCDGAPTPWGTWLSTEETVVDAGSGGWRRKHGYVFEVDAYADGPKKKWPIRQMGRFIHEGVAVDEETAVVYLTEDEGPDLFYRFVPKTFGKLHKGGTLQALKVRGQPRYNTIRGQTVGTVLPCSWVTIDDPDPDRSRDYARAVYRQGIRKGAAKFLYGEGATMVGDSCVFNASEGGEAGLGQIWRYTPRRNRGMHDERGDLVLLFESTRRSELDSPDCMCTSPNGAVVIAEDGHEARQFVQALLPDGTIFPIAENLVSMKLQLIDASGKLYDPNVPNDDYNAGDGLGRSEFAGPRFSPDGKWLFVNIQVPGITCAITGPWASLGL